MLFVKCLCVLSLFLSTVVEIFCGCHLQVSRFYIIFSRFDIGYWILKLDKKSVKLTHKLDRICTFYIFSHEVKIMVHPNPTAPSGFCLLIIPFLLSFLPRILYKFALFTLGGVLSRFYPVREVGEAIHVLVTGLFPLPPSCWRNIQVFSC